VPKLAAERGIDPDLVKPSRSPKVKVSKRLITNLDPRPVDVNPNMQQGQQQGQPVQAGASGPQAQQQFPQQQGPAFRMDYTVASTGAFWDSLYNFIRLMAAPDADGLTDQERINLGETWVAPFNHYLAGKEKTALAIALLATLSMFASKIKPARDRAKKEKEAKSNIDELRRAAREAGKKMPRPEAPPEAPKDAKPADIGDDGDKSKEAPPGRFIDMKGMESESND